MNYHHEFYDGSSCPYPPGKVACVGGNYLDHIKELNNPVPDEPILFMKPSTAFRSLSDGIILPDYSQNCHNSAKLAVLIRKRLSKAGPVQLKTAIAGYAIALHLTLRD